MFAGSYENALSWPQREVALSFFGDWPSTTALRFQVHRVERISLKMEFAQFAVGTFRQERRSHKMTYGWGKTQMPCTSGNEVVLDISFDRNDSQS